MTDLLTVPEVAELLRVSTWTVQAMCRDGRLPSVPALRRRRIPRAAVVELMGGAYDAPRDEPGGQAPAEAPAPRRRYGHPQDRSLAQTPVGGGGAVPGRVGPSEGDVAIRRVSGRSRGPA